MFPESPSWSITWIPTPNFTLTTAPPSQQETTADQEESFKGCPTAFTQLAYQKQSCIYSKTTTTPTDLHFESWGSYSFTRLFSGTLPTTSLMRVNWLFKKHWDFLSLKRFWVLIVLRQYLIQVHVVLNRLVFFIKYLIFSIIKHQGF